VVGQRSAPVVLHVGRFSLGSDTGRGNGAGTLLEPSSYPLHILIDFLSHLYLVRMDPVYNFFCKLIIFIIDTTNI
jgi:hypothetical protein